MLLVISCFNSWCLLRNVYNLCRYLVLFNCRLDLHERLSYVLVFALQKKSLYMLLSRPFLIDVKFDT